MVNTGDDIATRTLPGVTVVGIGASAGGIQALQGLFQALPPKLGVAFVVIVHLDPTHPSDLASILASPPLCASFKSIIASNSRPTPST